jgi:prepilin-type N-terminal cleavage/methylation domain-containing protein
VPHARARGFTLLEILLAIVIGGALLTAAISFALSMGELWGNGSETRLFDQHVRGVTRFLENLVAHAQPPPVDDGLGGSQAPRIGSQQQQQAQAQQQQQQQQRAGGQNQNAQQQQQTANQPPIAWMSPHGREFANDKFLTFELDESPGVFPWPDQPLPFVVCSLRVDPKEGLQLLWKSRLEIDYDTAAPRVLRVSPFVTGITYCYYNTSTGSKPTWEERDQPRLGTGGVPDLPQRLRLTFTYHGLTRTADLMLPSVTLAGVPLY